MSAKLILLKFWVQEYGTEQTYNALVTGNPHPGETWGIRASMTCQPPGGGGIVHFGQIYIYTGTGL